MHVVGVWEQEERKKGERGRQRGEEGGSKGKVDRKWGRGGVGSRGGGGVRGGVGEREEEGG